MRLTAKQAHRYVAGFIGLFLAVHFSAHFAALGGISTQQKVLIAGREVYQVPLFEGALVVALAAQIFLGIRLLAVVRHRKRKDWWHRLQWVSGCYLIFFIINHTAAALVTRHLVGLDTNFYWAAGTLVLAPLKLGFAPYYFLAVSALIGHLIAALHFRKPRRWHAPALLLGPLTGALFVLAYSGAFYPIELPDAHRQYFELFPGVEN